jgi:hypothetical protein
MRPRGRDLFREDEGLAFAAIPTCKKIPPSKRVVGSQLRHIFGRALEALRRPNNPRLTVVSHLAGRRPEIQRDRRATLGRWVCYTDAGAGRGVSSLSAPGNTGGQRSVISPVPAHSRTA